MIKKLVLLPGMDGTGELFADFVEALPDTFDVEVVRYPNNVCLPYAELIKFVRSAAPASGPFVLIAESFSTPLAIQYAAKNPPNLKALIICTGFVTTPLRGWRRFLASLFAPLMFQVTLPEFAVGLLVGPNAPSALVVAVRAAVSSVAPKVLSARLRTILACDARGELRNVTAPILYIRAEQDRLVPASCVDDIRRIQPQTAVVTIAGPHLLLQKEPEQTAKVVSRFAQRVDRRTDN
jgi:pimeloyl-ACP methyl ester carboxylesterase